MPRYSVGIVKRELREIWSEYWERIEPTERAAAAAKDGLLEQLVEVEAESPTEASAIAERENPDSVVVPDGVQHIQEPSETSDGSIEAVVEGDDAA